MKRPLAAYAVVCLGVWSAFSSPQVSAVEGPAYEIEDLGSIGGNFTMPIDINDAGDVVGTAQTSSGEHHAFLYTDAAGIRDVGALLGEGKSQAFGINNRRHLSGYFTRADGTLAAFLYGDDLGAVDLGALAGASTTAARGLNDADQVTGSSFLPTGAHAFLWSFAAGMQDLGTLGGAISNGARINARGQVAGQSITRDDPYFPIYHAFRHTEGSGMLDLGTLPGSSRSSSNAYGINADGEIVGYSSDPAYSLTRAFLYTDEDGMRDLGTLGGRSSSASNINDNGAIVGTAQLPSGQQHPFVYTRAAGMLDLNALIDSTSGWTLWTAEAINNRGTIVGVGTKDGRSRGYRARRVRDDTPPEIEAVVTPPPNAAGWNATDVTMRWRVRDPESGIESTSDCGSRSLTENTPGVTLTCTAVNFFGGATTRQITVRIDKTAPEIVPSVSPQPNAAGWHSGDVAVSWSVADPESGVASMSNCAPQTLTNETSDLTLTCTAVNTAGGSSSRSVTIKIDKTPPVLTCVATPSIVWPPNGEMVPVSIAVAVDDALSGGREFSLQFISIDDPTAGPEAVTGFAIGASSTSGFVQALRPGTDTGRVYAFTYTGIDAAGLTGSCTALVTVPHDER